MYDRLLKLVTIKIIAISTYLVILTIKDSIKNKHFLLEMRNHHENRRRIFNLRGWIARNIHP
jgi:hypothetical protein